MGGNNMVKLIVAVVVLGVGAYFVIPKFKTAVDSKIEGLKEWDDEARRKNPVGYIEFSMGKLQDNIGAFETLRGSLAAQKEALQKRRETSARTVSMGEKTAAAFKTAYQDAKKDAKWPTTVAGRPYNEGELKSQVALTLGEIEAQKSVVTQIEPIIVEVEARYNEVVARIGDSKGKLSILGAQKELVKAAKLTAETEKMLGQVQDVLVQNQFAIQRSPVRTLEEIAREDAKGAAAATPAVDAFLNG